MAPSRFWEWSLLGRVCNIAHMIEYRAYLLDSGGHVLKRVDLLCGDDGAAKKEAVQLVDGHDVELWSGDRLVIHLTSKKE